MSRYYEVTVPLVVDVKVDDEGAALITGMKIDLGFPGFHGDAEAAGGCWSTDLEQWWTEPHVEEVARSNVKALLGLQS